jgi:protein-tyrosine phosphatase
MAEGIMAKIAGDLKLNITVDSAGTSSWHAGEHPDKRAIETAAFHGVDISKLVARSFTNKDFETFDRIYVMDEMNYHDVIAQARSEEEKKKVQLFLEAAGGYFFTGVPDPYYGGTSGFEKIFAMLEDSCKKVLSKIYQP